MAEYGTQIPLLKYSPGRVLYYKKNLIEISNPQLAYSPCEWSKCKKLTCYLKIGNNFIMKIPGSWITNKFVVSLTVLLILARSLPLNSTRE